MSSFLRHFFGSRYKTVQVILYFTVPAWTFPGVSHFPQEPSSCERERHLGANIRALGELVAVGALRVVDAPAGEGQRGCALLQARPAPPCGLALVHFLFAQFPCNQPPIMVTVPARADALLATLHAAPRGALLAHHSSGPPPHGPSHSALCAL